MTTPGRLPEWAARRGDKLPDGVIPPVENVIGQVQLTERDVNGNRWIILVIADGTVSATVRMPWQSAPGYMAAMTDRVMQLAQQAAAEAGPQIVVPPAGVDLSKLNLGIKRDLDPRNGSANGR